MNPEAVEGESPSRATVTVEVFKSSNNDRFSST